MPLILKVNVVHEYSDYTEPGSKEISVGSYRPDLPFADRSYISIVSFFVGRQ